jgi:biopolymer transport protein ExbD
MAMRLGSSPDAAEEGDEDIVAEINITPLTDIFLVLLIIFMVTSSVMSSSGVTVNLPQASQSTSEAQPEGLIVTLLPAGEVQVVGQKLPKGDWKRMEEAVRTALAQTKSRLVILEGDREAFLGSAVTVMDVARKAGAEKFAIATSPEK